MDIHTFLSNLVIQIPDYVPTTKDKKQIEFEGVGKFILSKLNSSEFKATSITPDYLSKVIDKINLCVNHEVPIHLTVPFGAVKTSSLPTAPGIDWGEVFNIALLREYLSPIAKMYKQGVVLTYVSVSVFEQKMNYYSQSDIDLYDEEFEQLIKYYQSYLPKNFRLNFARLTDQLTKDKMLQMIDKKILELDRNWMNNSEEIRNAKIIRAKRNCCITQNDEGYDKKILQSIFVHDAFCSECWTLDVAPWDKKNMITLAFRYSDGWAIHVRSTRASTVNFWSGMGAIIEKGSKLIPTILSTTQYQSLKENTKSEKVDLFGKEFKNLSQIQIIYD